MKNAIKSLIIVLGCLAASTVWATDPTTTLDISTEAGSNAYYSLDALPGIKNLTWVGYNSTGSGNGGCISESHWKLSSSRTITFKVKNCSKVEAVDSYFSKDATTVLKYSINGGTATSFATNGTLKKICASGDFLTNNPNEITIVISADNDVILNELRFYKAGAVGPVAVTGVTVSPTTLTLEAGETGSLTATIAPSNADNKNVSWSSSDNNVATVDANGVVSAVSPGTATITATTEDGGKTSTCAVTVNAPAAPIPVTAISLNDASVAVGSTTTLTVTYTPADANTGKAISTWTSSNTSVAAVSNGIVTGVSAGTATITATTEGGLSGTCSVTVTAGPPVPATSLLVHQPEKYEAKTTDGGYGTALTIVEGNEYEVYYTTYTSSTQYPTFSTMPAADGKSDGISGSTSGTENVGKAGDTWFEGTIKETSTCQKASSQDEFVFATKTIREHRLKNTNSYKFHVEGYDQFTLWGMDKKIDASKKTYEVFVVKIDGVPQTSDTAQFNASAYTVRRYSMSTQRHLIEISTTTSGDNACAFGGFSLRVPKLPKIKKLKGNDTAQVVLQTTPISKVVYTCKYNRIAGAETRLEWENNKVATGISLVNIKQGDIVDTLSLTGTANCPVGTYNYSVVTYFNGTEVSRLSGHFEVTSDIRSLSETDVMVYKDEEMDPIRFRYYALSADDVILTWPNGAPQGISGSGSEDGKYFVIAGTPTAQAGTYAYEITVTGADTTIQGVVDIREAQYGDNAILYLYKNNNSYERDGIYTYLQSKNHNLIPRKAKEDGLRAATQYANYKWILISEDADADNAEIIELIDKGSSKPILNLKGFTYAKDDNRLGWGDPNNGAIDTAKVKVNGCNIQIERANHPIFSKLSQPKDGQQVKILEDYTLNGVMPIKIDNMPIDNSTCLATAWTRSMDNFYGLGELQTAIHEIPAGQGHGKYICLPISRTATLSADGKKLIDGIIDYLLSPTQASITAPELRITKFTVEGRDAVIDDTEKTIKLKLTVDDFKALDSLRTAKPVITLADPTYSHVTPASGEEVNLQYSIFLGKNYEVTDYVNRMVYEFKIQLINPQGLEEVYESGSWVNIFDMYGRKVATTNEDIYSMTLPRGIYIVVTESGQTIKLLK